LYTTFERRDAILQINLRKMRAHWRNRADFGKRVQDFQDSDVQITRADY
jgi:hypothetical protein